LTLPHGEGQTLDAAQPHGDLGAQTGPWLEAPRLREEGQLREAEPSATVTWGMQTCSTAWAGPPYQPSSCWAQHGSSWLSAGRAGAPETQSPAASACSSLSLIPLPSPPIYRNDLKNFLPGTCSSALLGQSPLTSTRTVPELTPAPRWDEPNLASSGRHPEPILLSA
jgi:hypothetical protein